MPRIFFFLFLSLFFFSVSLAANHTSKLCIKDVCVETEVVDLIESRQRGLMFRESLGENQGMLFIFEDEDWHNFWMKNMNFSLDIIWIDTKQEIVDIKENVQPCRETCDSIAPAKKSKYALEVNSGFVKKNDIKIGDRVKF